ncbi:PREDICTED: F-box and leucine-rich protein 22 [Galeopterus variegatus]|uniref:F-box and leucine-rich protein 22 n=1 Tax=Galeopterus variegatus TaxID=482537 RepID=A0ABM0QFF1_GALVR|nr:PREDICTED: F-box and leucine-rich protein 22 [Galeopterus variegatus]
MHITQLNRECLLHLFSFLDKDSRKNLASTCSQLHAVFEDPVLWPLLHFHSLTELKKDNFLLGPALRSLSICWYSSRVQVCSIEDWLKSTFQRSICSRHERLVDDFLLQVCDRCPNLASVTLSGCGHVTDDCLARLLRCCPRLRALRLENCARVSNRTLAAVAAHGRALQTLHVDFCRNFRLSPLAMEPLYADAKILTCWICWTWAHAWTSNFKSRALITDVPPLVKALRHPAASLSRVPGKIG